MALANADEPKNLQTIECPKPLVAEMFIDLVSPPQSFARLASSSTDPDLDGSNDICW
jgi:hypothetical protein